MMYRSHFATGKKSRSNSPNASCFFFFSFSAATVGGNANLMNNVFRRNGAFLPQSFTWISL